MGSSDYAGNAGSLAAAIFQGLYGVYLSEQALNLKIRLGDQSGQIHLYQPATDKYVAYRYCYSEAAKTATINYESNSPGSGELCVLLPKNRQLEKLTVDGKKRSFTRRQTGEDSYGCFSTDWKTHQSELSMAQSPGPKTR
jgi:hypothetical protein